MDIVADIMLLTTEVWQLPRLVLLWLFFCEIVTKQTLARVSNKHVCPSYNDQSYQSTGALSSIDYYGGGTMMVHILSTLDNFPTWVIGWLIAYSCISLYCFIFTRVTHRHFGQNSLTWYPITPHLHPCPLALQHEQTSTWWYTPSAVPTKQYRELPLSFVQIFPSDRMSTRFF